MVADLVEETTNSGGRRNAVAVRCARRELINSNLKGILRGMESHKKFCKGTCL